MVEPERTGHSVGDLGAGVDRAAVIQPGVPGDADTGELGDLLRAQPGGAAPDPRGQAGVLRPDAFPAAAQERGELGPPGAAIGGHYGAHLRASGAVPAHLRASGAVPAPLRAPAACPARPRSLLPPSWRDSSALARWCGYQDKRARGTGVIPARGWMT